MKSTGYYNSHSSYDLDHEITDKTNKVNKLVADITYHHKDQRVAVINAMIEQLQSKLK